MNPIFPGWYADPDLVAFGDRYWIYPTYSAAYDDQTFLDAFSSPDLVTWTKHSRVTDATRVRWVKRALWAPCCVENGGRYFLFFAGNDIHPGQLGGIGVAVADRPEGPFEDHLGKPLISDFHHGAQPIDQAVLRGPDGQWYIVYGGWKHCMLAKLRDDFTGLIPWPDGALVRDITPAGYVEGPMFFVREGRVYFMWSEGGWTGPDYRVAYAIADSFDDPFERRGTVLQQDATIATGAGHHTVLAHPTTGEHYIAYHRRPLGVSEPNHREVCIDRLHLNPDGTIRPVVMTTEGVAPQRL